MSNNIILILTRMPIVAMNTRKGKFDVYNLEVEGTHNYFVGDQNVLVHNKPAITKPSLPNPPGWNESWQWRYPEVNAKGTGKRWFDTNGGEWRWYEADKWHPEGHWDYNPWDQWNSAWQNIDVNGNVIPK